MIIKILIKVFYLFIMNIYIMNKRFFGNKQSIINWILDINNNIVKFRIKNKKIRNILLLLPHCVQNHECKIRVTNNLENCVKCGRCKIGDLFELNMREINLHIRIATGGTLARRYIKEIRPELIIAVACERDLMSGIFDSVPIPVYGAFNKIIKSECIGTDFSINEIKNIINYISLRGIDEKK